MEHTSSTATNNNWCYQSFFIDTDYIYFYLHTIIEYSLILKVNVLLLFSYLSITNNDRIFTFIV